MIRPISQRKAESDKVYRKAVRRWWSYLVKMTGLVGLVPVCLVCRKRDAEKSPHHIIPKSLRKDLEADEKNFLAVCWKCHRYIHDHPAWAYSRGYLGKSTDSLEELAERRAQC